MATDILKALEEARELKLLITEGDYLFNKPHEASKRITDLVLSVQPTLQNDLDTATKLNEIHEIYAILQVIREEAEGISNDSVLAYAEKERQDGLCK